MKTPFVPRDVRSTPNHLPRLPRPYYQADATVHWTLTSRDRHRWDLGPVLHAGFRELMLHAATREEVICPIYCLMPDHIHLVWIGTKPSSDQLNGMAFLRTHLRKMIHPAEFQPQAYDRVLRERSSDTDAIRQWVQYGILNPIRAGLAGDIESWPWLGCIVPGIPVLNPIDPGFWELFGKLHRQRHDPTCAHHVKPMLG